MSTLLDSRNLHIVKHSNKKIKKKKTHGLGPSRNLHFLVFRGECGLTMNIYSDTAMKNPR